MDTYAAALIGAAVVALIVCLITLGICVTIYVLGALGAYKLAKRRGMTNAWLSWLPVGQEYILGKMANNISVEEPPYQKRGWWIAYPILSGAMLLFALVNSVIMLSSLPDYILRVIHAAMYGSEQAVKDAALSFVSGSGGLLVIGLLVNLLSIAAAVIGSILLYRVYKRYWPNAAMAFAVCGGIFGLHWLFLFIIRNRRPLYAYYPQNGYGAPFYTDVPPQNPYQNGQPNPYVQQDPYDSNKQPPQPNNPQ